MIVVACLFEFKNSLCDRGDDRVVPTLDVGEQFREAFVVVVHLGRPFDRRVGICVITKRPSVSAPPSCMLTTDRCDDGPFCFVATRVLPFPFGCAFMCAGRDGFGVETGRAGVPFFAFVKASYNPGGRSGLGKSTNS